MSAHELITDHLDLWTQAVTQKSTAGRGRNGKVELTGIKKLRELILELAVRGKLMEQDPDDEPASDLLRAAANEKAQALKDKRIRKSQIGVLCPTFSKGDVPDGWVKTTLANIGYWAIGNGFPKVHQGESGLEILFCKVSDMNLPENNREIHATINSVSEETAHSLKLNIHRHGTVIFPKIGGAISTNKRRVVVKPTAIDNNCLGITPTCAISSDYLYLLLTSVDMTQYQVGTSVPALSQGTLGKISVKLPPLEEQHRIVQKVDGLMALCDRLEQHTGAQLDAHETLVDTLLGILTQSANATELADNWARLAEHFDTLFTTEQSIDKLKQTILQLAVMGRLVEQEEGDESAKELVAAATQARETLILEDKLKRPRKVKNSTDGESIHKLPYGWIQVKVGELFQLQNGYAFKSSWFSENGPRLLRNINVSHGYIDWSNSACLPETMAIEFERFALNKGDIVISLDRPLISTGLKYAIIRDCDTPCFLLQRVARFRQYCEVVDIRYLEHWLNSEMFTNSIDPGRSNGVPHISTGQIEALDFPLPPKTEQHRIVQKVDELMAICDQLKERLNQASDTRCQLAGAVVEGALEG